MEYVFLTGKLLVDYYPECPLVTSAKIRSPSDEGRNGEAQKFLHRKMGKLYDIEHFRIKFMLFTCFSVKGVFRLNHLASPEQSLRAGSYYKVLISFIFIFFIWSLVGRPRLHADLL